VSGTYPFTITGISGNTVAQLRRDVVVVTGSSPNVITFPAGPTTTLDAGPVTLAATSSSGLSVSYNDQFPYCVYSVDSSVTLVAVGQCSITRINLATEPTPPRPCRQDFHGVSRIVAEYRLRCAREPHVLVTRLPSLRYREFRPCGEFRQPDNGHLHCVREYRNVIQTGTCTISGHAGRHGNYAPAAPVSQRFTVLPSPTGMCGSGYQYCRTITIDHTESRGVRFEQLPDV